jgi:DNA recombination protein RmuC
MMTNEQILLNVGLPILALVLGYLAAVVLGRKQHSALQQQLIESQAESRQFNENLTKLTTTYDSTASRLRTVELEQESLKANLQSETGRKKELEEELGAVKESAEQTLQAKHLAEKVVESAKAELQEARNQQQDIQSRLTTANDELKVERSAIADLKNDKASIGEQAKGFEVQAQEAQKKSVETKASLTSREKKHEELQARYDSLSNEFTELKTALDERDASHAREVETFDKQKDDLTQQFKVLSTEILAANTKSLQESSKVTLSSVINPFQQSIDGFKKEVQDIHHRETTQRSELKKELESLKELNQKITTEAHELSTALRGQKKLQGNWGELVLENVLDRSGLVLGKDYKREVSFTTEEGRQRPDAVVYLPQDKHLIIDAKVSLNAYTRFINSEDDDERKVALDEHVKAMGDRINELADRDYYKLPGLNSPDMVFMFVPIESAFVEALKADETLFQKAIENNVLVATPTTLLTSLNIVRQLWRYEDQNKHTVALAQKAESVFKKLNTFLSNFEGVKKGLDKATEAYGKAEGQLVSGRGNLVKQVGEFKNLAPAIKAELPSYFTEKADLEIDYIPAENRIEVSAADIKADSTEIESALFIKSTANEQHTELLTGTD